MNKILISDIWRPPCDDKLSLIKTGNQVIDEFSAEIRKSGNNTIYFFAKRLNIDPILLNSVIKSCTGKSSREWKNSLILLDAEWYLLYTMLTVPEIADKLKFTTANNFSTFFKLNRDLVPAHYRKKYRIVEIEYKIKVLKPLLNTSGKE